VRFSIFGVKIVYSAAKQCVSVIAADDACYFRYHLAIKCFHFDLSQLC